MRQFINKDLLNELLQIGDLQNSLDGGRSAVYSRLNVRDNVYELEVKIPSANISELIIEISGKNLNVYNLSKKRNSEGEYIAIPANFRAYAIPKDADATLIEAIEIGVDEVMIRIPKGIETDLKRKRIKIRQKRWGN